MTEREILKYIRSTPFPALTKQYGWKPPWCWECGKLMMLEHITTGANVDRTIDAEATFRCINASAHKHFTENTLVFKTPYEIDVIQEWLPRPPVPWDLA